jgi:hypothetical protein
MAYPLPQFVSRTLADQPLPPRRVPFPAVVQAVVGGADCAIYAIGALVLLVIGAAVTAHALPSSSRGSDVPGGLVIIVVGLVCALLPSFRVWQVERALRDGDALIADIIQAGVGPARIYGTPWGEPMGTRMQPIVATGRYRLIGTGETGRYYMQQTWATALQPGARIWVLRHSGRDILYAPVKPVTPAQ